VWKKEPDVCMSTEEMMARIKKVNEDILSGWVNGSKLKALYPSLKPGS